MSDTGLVEYKDVGGRPLHWTEWRVRRIMRALVQDLKDEEGRRGKTLTFQELLSKRDLYPQIIGKWRAMYGETEWFRESIDSVKNIIEGRVVSGALRKSLDPFFASFNLKNNFGWSDDPAKSQREEETHQVEMAKHSERLAEARRANMLPENAG